MKKKLEAELISIAHRILKMKNKDDVKELHKEARNLYEKLSVLVFVEENFNIIKPTINVQEVETNLENYYNQKEVNNSVITNTTPVLEEEQNINELVHLLEEIKANVPSENIEIPENDSLISVTSQEVPSVTNSITHIETIEKKEEEIIFKPLETTSSEEIIPETPYVENTEIVQEDPHRKILEKRQILMDELLGHTIAEPIFEKVTESTSKPIAEKIIEEEVKVVKTEPTEDFFSILPEITFEKKTEDKAGTNLNDKMGKTAGLSLNDRMAFENNLFDGSTADLNRVISQIATFDSFQEAKTFIEEMVKPDYNDWKGKDEFASRFMEYVESKFV